MADSKIFSGSLALLISGAGQSLIQILVLAVLARLIAPESFGILALTLAIGDLIRVLARFGISQAVVQRDGVGSTSLGTAYWSALVLGAMCSLGIFSIAGIVARYFSVPELEFVLSIFSISIFVTSFSIVSEALLYRNYDFKVLGGARLAAYILGYGVVGVILALQGMEYKALVYSYITQQVVLSLFYILRSKYIPSFEFSFLELKDIFSFGFGYSIGQLATIAALRIDSLLIGKLMGPVALSFYDRSYQLMRFPAFLLATIVDDVLFPVFSKNKNDKEVLRSGFLNGLGLLSVVLIPLSVILTIKSDLVIAILLGPSWGGAVPIFAVLSVALFFRSAQRVGTALMRAQGLVYQAAVFQFLYLLVIVLAVFIGSSSGLVLVAVLVSLAIFINFSIITVYAVMIIKSSYYMALLYTFSGLGVGIVFAFSNTIATLMVYYYDCSVFFDFVLTVFLNVASLYFVIRYFRLFVPRELADWMAINIFPRVKGKIFGRK